jgi:hypothetical protein
MYPEIMVILLGPCVHFKLLIQLNAQPDNPDPIAG